MLTLPPLSYLFLSTYFEEKSIPYISEVTSILPKITKCEITWDAFSRQYYGILVYVMSVEDIPDPPS